MGSMADHMRGGPRPEPVASCDLGALEAAFGAPLGPLLAGLHQLRCSLDPLQMDLCGDPEQLRMPWTPDEVLPFCQTDDLAHAAFLAGDPALPLDRRAVCFVTGEECRVVAPDLAVFLGLVAVSGMAGFASSSDEAWLAAREERIHPAPEDESEDEERDEGFLEASSALCSLPGVALPPSPMQVVREAASRYPRIATPEPLTRSGLDRVRELLEAGRRERARTELIKQLDIIVGIGDLAARERWLEARELVAVLDPPLSDDVRRTLSRRAGA